MIKVLSYGSGNIAAITNIFERLSIPFEIATYVCQLENASKLILPGVGAFDQTMQLLQSSGMREQIDELVTVQKLPVLGVCVGMQIMAMRSEEGSMKGLGWIDADVVRLDTTELHSKPFLPHMGWNSIRATANHPILDGVDCSKGFYFLHSYCFKCRDESDVLCYSDYGQSFPSAVRHNNVFGFQFHPEKSHQNGISVFRNFAKL